MSNYKKYAYRWLAVLGLMFCVYFPCFNVGTTFVFVRQVVASWLPSEEDYKLKFVSVSLQTQDALGDPMDVLMPVEVLDFRQGGEFIVVQTFPQSVVACPISTIVKIDEKNKVVAIEKFGYKLEISGFSALGVNNGEFVKTGMVVGTLKTDELYLKISKNGRVLSLEELRSMF